ncbi:hypothetical protein CTZ27_03850 [Streptomyces griseocarneus]|nr:hypothetical protein CTZ27_03850 [Streptomyces griseocarneus]
MCSPPSGTPASGTTPMRSSPGCGNIHRSTRTPRAVCGSSAGTPTPYAFCAIRSSAPPVPRKAASASGISRRCLPSWKGSPRRSPRSAPRCVPRPRATSPRAGIRSSASCARHCDRLLAPIVDRLRDGATVDLHAELVYPFTWSVISDVMGIPEPERARIVEHALPTLAAFNPSLPDEEFQRAEEAGSRLAAYFTGLLERRRGDGPPAETPPDLVTCLADSLAPRQAVGVLWAIWAAGYESTVGGIVTAVLAMLDHPDQAHFLDGTWEQADAFVTECLRYDAPVWGTGVSRAPREPVELGGVLVPPTADLRVLFGAANRDPAAFPDPDRFRPGRSPNQPPMVTFGQGPHYCLGASLARIEMITVLTRLRRHLPDLTLAAPPRRCGTGALRRFEELMVAV